MPLGRHVSRAQAAWADPRVGEAATGDLDAGVYRVRHGLVRELGGTRESAGVCLQCI